MKVNNRGLYCGLTFLAASLLLAGTHGMDEDEWGTGRSVWNDSYLLTDYVHPRLSRKGRFIGRQFAFFNDSNRCYEGHYNERSGVFEAYDGDSRKVSPAHVYFLNCPFRRGDRVACYWNETIGHMNPGTVECMGVDTCLIQFDDGAKKWMSKLWIHGLAATVAKPNPSFDRQPAPARYEKCDHLARFSNPNRYYEGHYDYGTETFTAHDGDEKSIDSCFVYPMGVVFEENDDVACYLSHEMKHLRPGKVTERGYGHSCVKFRDDCVVGNAMFGFGCFWMPNDFIHKASCADCSFTGWDRFGGYHDGN